MSKLASSSVQNISPEVLNAYFRPLKKEELSTIDKMRYYLSGGLEPPSYYFDEADVEKARQELAQDLPRLSSILKIIAIGNKLDKEAARPAGSKVELREIVEAARPAGSEVEMSEIVKAARPAGSEACSCGGCAPLGKFYDFDFGLGGGKSRRVKSRRVKSKRNKRRTQHRNTRK